MTEENQSPSPSISPILEKHQRNWKKILLILLILGISVSLIGVGVYFIGTGDFQTPSSQKQETSSKKKETIEKYKSGLYFSRDASVYRVDYKGEDQEVIIQNAVEKDFFVYNLTFSSSKKYLTWTSWTSETHPLNLDLSGIFYYSNINSDKNSISYKHACKAIGYDLDSEQDFVYLWNTTQSTDKRNDKVKGSLSRLNLVGGSIEPFVKKEVIGPKFHISPNASKILSIPCLSGGGTAKAEILNADSSEGNKIDFILYSLVSDAAWINNDQILGSNERNNSTVKIVSADGSSSYLIPIDTSYEQAGFGFTDSAKNHISHNLKNILIITHLYGKASKGGNVYKYELDNEKLVKISSLEGFEEQMSSYGWLPDGGVWFTTNITDSHKYDLWTLSLDGTREKILTEITAHVFN